MNDENKNLKGIWQNNGFIITVKKDSNEIDFVIESGQRKGACSVKGDQ